MIHRILCCQATPVGSSGYTFASSYYYRDYLNTHTVLMKQPTYLHFPRQNTH